MGLKALGHQQITVLTASTALTVPVGTTLVLVTPTGTAVRWRDDGVAPTASIGYPLAANTELSYDGRDPTLLRFIEQSASSVLNVAYYGSTLIN